MSDRNPNAFDWTEEALARLKTLAPQLSAGQIAGALSREFGASITRNAVIGKLRRIGTPLSKPRAPSSAGDVEKRPAPEEVDALADRIGDPDPADVPPCEQAVERAAPKIAKRKQNEAAAFPPPLAVVPAAPQSEATELESGAVAESRLCSFDDLKWHHCRWPIGDVRTGGVMYCGAPKGAGKPYCCEHHARAYTAPVRVGKPVIRWNHSGKRRTA